MIDIKDFFHKETATLTYIVTDVATRQCAIIDPVLDFDLASGCVTTSAADDLLDYVKKHELTVQWLLETHIHADHLTAAQYLKEKTDAPIAIGSNIKLVLDYWIPHLNIANDTAFDASQFDVLLDDGAEIPLGQSSIRIMHTPGHTPACISYIIDDNIFVGDALFNPDVGTGRADFPGGSAAMLYDSIQKILGFADEVTIYCCHDYPPPERTQTGKSTVAEQNQKNILIRAHTAKEEFITKRRERDCGKAPPKLLYPSIQINLRAGSLGNPESNGVRFVKIPLNLMLVSPR